MTDQMPKIDIRPDHWQIVCDILQKHVPNHEVWAFGSRAKWTAKEYSDLDLAVITEKPLSLAVSANLSDDFSESDLPWKVDVVDWATTGESFRKIIERDKVVVQRTPRAAHSTWRTMTIEDCMAAIIDYRGKTPTKTNSGIPLITAKIVKGGRLTEPDEFIAENAYEQWMTRGLPMKGDVVLTTEAPLGEVAQLDGRKVALAQRIITLRGKPGLLDNTYLKFVLQSRLVQARLSGRASGSTVSGIKQSELRKVELPIPSWNEQSAIAHILGSLDDKIELNRRINQTLEEMAQAIFKSWFVDFDPVKAKITAQAEGRDPLRAAMRAISGKTDAELDALPREHYNQLAATADLFPEEMEESDLGDIPKGWHVRSMPECIDVNPIRQLKKGTVAPYLDMANVPTNSARARNVVPREFSSGSKFLNGDTLLARITPCLENGKTAFVDFLDEKQIGWGSTEFIVLRPKSQLPVEFAYFLARHAEFRSFSIAQMAGTSGRQRVPNDCFNNYFLVEPSREPAKVFGVLAKSVLNEIKSLDKSSQLLEQLRDSLLPKLLSGELSVTDIAASIDKTPS